MTRNWPRIYNLRKPFWGKNSDKKFLMYLSSLILWYHKKNVDIYILFVRPCVWSVVQSLSHVQLFVTPWNAICQVSLSYTIFWSLLKLMCQSYLIAIIYISDNWEILKAGEEGDDRRWDGCGHHQFSEHEFEQALGDGKGQGSLVCYSPWNCKESDTNELLNNK